MTKILIISLLLIGCSSITHKRGSNAQLLLNVYHQNLSEANACFDNIPTKEKPTGSVTLEWTIDDKGIMTQAQITNQSTHYKPLEDCLLTHLKSLKFPPSPNFSTATAIYTHNFKVTR